MLPGALVLFVLAGLLAEEPSYTWDDCINYAGGHNSDINSAQYQIEAAEKQYGISRSVLFPTVSAQADVSQSQVLETDDSSQTGYSVGLSGKQQLYSSSFNDIPYYEILYKKQLMSYNSTMADVRYALRSSFVNLLYSKYLVTINKGIARRRAENAKLVKSQYEGGREHKGNYLSAKASYSKAANDLESAQKSAALYGKQLARLMGMELGTTVDVSGEFAAPSLTDEPDFDSLTAGDYGVQELIYECDSLESKWKSAKLGYTPDVYATGNVSRSGGVEVEPQTSLSVGVEASLTIFDGFQTSGSIDLAKINLQEAKERLREQKSLTYYTLEEDWNSLEESIKNITVQKEYLVAAEESARIYKSEYSLGLVTYSNWASVEDELASAQISYASAINQALLAEALWEKDKGVTLEHEN